ncbi:hypothetical protein L7F22_041134 [Adiantum nelumboides]|nr:hypothetical protein [Adiantum nelumboides]
MPRKANILFALLKSAILFIISADGISVDPEKIKDIVEWPQPSSVSKVRGFLGITGWYRIIVKDYALIAAPLTGLLKKGMRIDWKAEHEASFSELKGYLVFSPILKLPNFSKEFEVVTDASGLALGGVLTQERRPVDYTLRKLRDHERNYPTHDLELLAVIHALKLWRHYLLSRKFQLVTDHKSLKWIFTQPNLNMRQRRWIELLQKYDFDIKYRPGKNNVVADGLSRKSFLNVISIPNNPILDMIKKASQKDSEYQDLICRIQNSGETKEISKPTKEYSLQGGFLYYEQRLCVPKDPTLKKAIPFEAHDNPISGHPGYAKTLNAIRKSYSWPGMKSDILRYVKQFLFCQRIKAE